jgi:plasmid stabilization system protein ParE
MANKSLRLHPEAEQEYLAALDWYRDRSPTAALQFQNAVRHAGQTIQEAPHRWPIYFGNFRKYTLRQFPFSLIYQEMVSEIVVFAIAHGSRRPGYWKDRE